MSASTPSSVDFEVERKAYYEAKESYIKLRDEAMAKRTNSDDTISQARPSRPLTEELNTRQLPSFPAPKISHGKGSASDVQAVAKAVFTMREASGKGQSKIKKSDWDKMDKLLGG